MTKNHWPKWDSKKKKWSPEEITYSVQAEGFFDSESIIEKTGIVRPHWGKWKAVRVVSIDTAVLLALDLNPDVFSWFAWSEAPKNVEVFRDVSLTLQHLYKDGFGYRCVDLIEYGLYVRSNLSHLLPSQVLPKEFPRRGQNSRPNSVQSGSNEGILEVTPQSALQPVPPYMTPKLIALYKMMEEVNRKPEVKPIDIVMDMTSLPERDARPIAAIINPRPDGRSATWPSEDENFRYA